MRMPLPLRHSSMGSASGLGISPKKVKEMLDKKEDFLLLDVREPFEHACSNIPRAQLVPLNEIPAHLSEWPKDKPIVTMCHHGIRSLAAAEFLVRNGFKNVKSMNGGIDAYAVEADPKIKRYEKQGLKSWVVG